MRASDETTVEGERKIAYRQIMEDLWAFGYPQATVHMVREIHEAMGAGTKLPHGVVGLFARKMLTEFDDR